MPRTMKAAVVESVGARFAVTELTIDDPIGQEVLVEVRASGLCHSDLHIATQDYGYPMPIVLGHELAGVVVAVGDAVTSVRVGDHVVGSLIQFCGRCTTCLRGLTHQCRNGASLVRDPSLPPRLSRDGASVFPGMGLGAFAEFSLVHEHQLVVVPDALPLPAACLLGCGVITGMGAALNSSPVRPGESIAIIGVGGVGLSAVAGARLAGAETIIAVDLNPRALELAGRFGATHTVDARKADAVAAVLELVPEGVDHAFEVVGTPATTYQGMAMLRLGGTISLIALHAPGSAIELVDIFPNYIMRQMTIRAVNMGSTNLRRDIPLYARLALDGRLDLGALVAREIDLGEIDAAYAALGSGQVARSVITSFAG